MRDYLYTYHTDVVSRMSKMGRVCPACLGELERAARDREALYECSQCNLEYGTSSAENDVPDGCLHITDGEQL